MRFKPEEYWKDHVKLWKESGLSRHAYCKENDLVQSTLTRWIKKLGNNIVPVKIELPEKSIESEIRLETPDLRLYLPKGIDASVLMSVIRELKTCS